MILDLRFGSKGKDYEVVDMNPGVIPESDFIKRAATVVSAMAAAVTTSHTVLAASASEPMSAAINAAFHPLIAVVNGFAFPLTYFLVLCGIILYALGRKGQAKTMIRSAVLAYIAIQFMPAAGALLKHLGHAIQAAETAAP